MPELSLHSSKIKYVLFVFLAQLGIKQSYIELYSALLL